MSHADSTERVEQEIRAEKTSALRRAVEALEEALAALARHDEARGAPGALRADLLAEAGERLWYVVIQREAMGLLRHDVLYEVVRVPPEVRRAMGPRRR